MNPRPLGNLFRLSLIGVVWSMWAIGVSGTHAYSQDAAAFQKRLDAAMPGEVIELRSGTYSLQQPWVLNRSGAQGQPITIRALTNGRVIITGKAGFVLKGASHVVIEGFDFRHDNSQPAIALIDCQHVRITRNKFHLTEEALLRQNWVSIAGPQSGQNRIDHNLFENKSARGAYIAIDGSDGEPYRMSTNDRIDHNHFRLIGPDNDTQPPLKGADRKSVV